MKLKQVRAKYKQEGNNEAIIKQAKIYHAKIEEEDLHDSCSVNIHNTKNLNQLNDYYQSIIEKHEKNIQGLK